MPGQNSQTTNQSQNSSTSPWAPTQSLLQSLLSRFGNQNTDVTGAQTSALNSLSQGANALPNFGAQGSGALNNYFSASTQPQIGMLQDSFKQLQGNLGATASGANLNPYSTPGFGDALNTMTSDITNSVKGAYGGSGRDPSGAGSFAQSLGRGLTQGEAPTIANQSNQNMQNMFNANDTLFGAGQSTANNITGQQSTGLGYGAQGLGMIPSLMNAYTSPGQAQLGAANAQYGQSYQNLMQMLQPLLQMGSMGSQSNGGGTSTTAQPQNMWSNILGGLSGGMGLLSLFSDKRLKTNIQPVGKLNDGQTVHRFQYKGSPVTHIGLLAQEVQKAHPRAVSKMPGGMGMLGVNYGTATDAAAQMGAPADPEKIAA